MLLQKRRAKIPRPRITHAPSTAQRAFYESRYGKHSDLTPRGRVTVMAVAKDFHLDFLIRSAFIPLSRILYH